jgi:hypothetical protein
MSARLPLWRVTPGRPLIARAWGCIGRSAWLVRTARPGPCIRRMLPGREAGRSRWLAAHGSESLTPRPAPNPR